MFQIFKRVSTDFRECFGHISWERWWCRMYLCWYRTCWHGSDCELLLQDCQDDSWLMLWLNNEISFLSTKVLHTVALTTSGWPAISGLLVARFEGQRYDDQNDMQSAYLITLIKMYSLEMKAFLYNAVYEYMITIVLCFHLHFNQRTGAQLCFFLNEPLIIQYIFISLNVHQQTLLSSFN